MQTMRSGAPADPGLRDPRRWAAAILLPVLGGCPATTGDVLSLPTRDAGPTDTRADAGLPVTGPSLAAEPPPRARVGRAWTWRLETTGDARLLERTVTTTPELAPRLDVEADRIEVTVVPEAVGPLEVVVSVEDERGTATATATVEVRRPLVATATVTAPGMVGVPVTTTLAVADFGLVPYRWSADPRRLPGGLSLERGDVATLRGVPTSSGTFGMVLDVTDAEGDRDTVETEIRIDPALVIQGPAALETTLGAQTEVAYRATGGAPPYRWSSTGTFPPGMTSLTSSAGPTAAWAGLAGAVGRYPFTVRVEDRLGRSLERAAELVVADSGARLAIEGPRSGRVAACRPFEAELRTVGGGGVGTEWQVDLPEGLVAEAVGTRLKVAGLFVDAGARVVEIEVRDANGELDRAELRVDVDPADTRHLGGVGRWFVRRPATANGPWRAGDRCRWPPTDEFTEVGSHYLTRLADGRYGYAEWPSGSQTRTFWLLDPGPNGVTETLVYSSTSAISFGQPDVPYVDGRFAVFAMDTPIYYEPLDLYFDQRRVYALPMEPSARPIQLRPRPNVFEQQRVEGLANRSPFAIIQQGGDEHLVIDVRNGQTATPPCRNGTWPRNRPRFVDGTRQPTVLYQCPNSGGYTAWRHDGTSWVEIPLGSGNFSRFGGPWMRASNGTLINLDSPSQTYSSTGPQWAGYMSVSPGYDWAAGLYAEPRESPFDARNPPAVYLSALPPPPGATGPQRVTSLSFSVSDPGFASPQMLSWNDSLGLRLAPLPLGLVRMTLPRAERLLRLIGDRYVIATASEAAGGGLVAYDISSGTPREVWHDPRFLGVASVRVDNLGARIWGRDRSAFLDLLSGFEPRVVTATTAAAWPRLRVVDPR